MLNKRFQDLAKQLDEKKRTKNMLEGELLSLEKEVQNMNIENAKQAEEELSKLKDNREKIIKRIENQLNEFEDKFKGNLNV